MKTVLLLALLVLSALLITLAMTGFVKAPGTEPFVYLFSPNASYYNTTSIDLRYIASGTLDTVWYNYTNGNVTITGNLTITGAEGTNNITLWANSTTNDQNNTVPFTVNIDTQPPNTTVDNQSATIRYSQSIAVQGTCHDDGVAGLDYAYTNSSYFSSPEQLAGSDDIFNITNTTGIPDGPVAVYVICNDTYGNNMNFSVFTFTLETAGYLNTSMVEPVEGALVPHMSLFGVNATVICEDGDCGNVYAVLLYNASSAYPDTSVPETDSSPFYIMHGQNQQYCQTNPLSADEFCNITWRVNATGAIGDNYKFSAVFQSVLEGVDENQTENVTAQITTCFISTTLFWDAVEFGSVNPMTLKPAPGNANLLYNITSGSSCVIDLYIKGSNLTNDDNQDYNITVDNIIWSNISNSYGTGRSLDFSWLVVNRSVWAGYNDTQYFWIQSPGGTIAGKYEGNITVEGVESGTSP